MAQAGAPPVPSAVAVRALRLERRSVHAPEERTGPVDPAAVATAAIPLSRAREG